MILNTKRETLLKGFVKYFSQCVRSFSEVVGYKYRKEKTITEAQISKYFTIRTYDEIKQDIMDEKKALCVTVDSNITDIVSEEDINVFYDEVSYMSALWLDEYILELDKENNKVYLKLTR